MGHTHQIFLQKKKNNSYNITGTGTTFGNKRLI